MNILDAPCNYDLLKKQIKKEHKCLHIKDYNNLFLLQIKKNKKNIPYEYSKFNGIILEKNTNKLVCNMFPVVKEYPDIYNYENIKIKLKDNAGIQYDDLLLKIKDSNNNLYAQYSVKEDDIDKYIVPPIEKAGTYYLYLLNNNQKVSNKLTISIYNYDNEDILKGQNVEYLKKVASKTNGLYSNEENFLANLKNNTINYKINYNKDIYDVKDYLLVLLIAILALIVDWYLRKKRGLL